MADILLHRRTPLNCALLLAVCLFMQISISAQTEVTAGLRGTITAESTGAPVMGARVVVKNETLQAQREAITDEHGWYAISGLPPGANYEIP